MIESHINKELERKIDLYVNGQLSQEEIDELWAELIQDENQLDYLKTVANAKAVIEDERKRETKFFSLKRTWAYAAAAVVILLIGVLTVMNTQNMPSETVEPITSIELDYYRSENGVRGIESQQKVLKNALTLANQGNTSQAIEILETELETAENTTWIAELHINIGSLYYNEGKYQASIENFQKVVDRQSVDVLTREKGYWYLGNAYFQLNELDKAQQAIQKAYELNGAYRRVAKHYLDALAST